jgi:hypothetical protein
MTAILWAWSGEQTLTARFGQAKKIARRMLGNKGVPDSSYQAFMKLLWKWTTAILIGLALVFRRKMERQFADRWRIGRFVCFGVDGSRFELPRTAANEAYFCAPKTRPARRLSKKDKNQNKKNRRRRKHRQSAAARSKKASNPQMWVTTMREKGDATHTSGIIRAFST